jgi:hypothetical protein
MPIYKLQGRAHLSGIGRWFRAAGFNAFRFMPGELQDLSDELLDAVKAYVPVRTGVLESSLVAQANINAIQVVARTDVMMNSEYAKDYAGYVEAGVFGKDESRVIKTPQRGGPIFVKSPKSYEGAQWGDAIIDQALGIAAHQVQNGYAQFMRAGIYDFFPKLLRHFSRVIPYKLKQTFRRFK